MADARPSRDELALCHANRRFAELRPEQTVQQALDSIRSQPLDSPIVYLYVVDDDRRLHGVVPTRRLLTAAPGALVSSVMTPATVTLPLTASLEDAAALLVRSRLLAVPLVGELGRVYGVLDAATLGVEIGEEVNRGRLDELFQLLGVHVDDGGAGSYRSRYLPLLCNVAGGLLAAVVVAFHDQLLTTAAALALFMPVTLALSESIGMQAVAVVLERSAAASRPRSARRLLADELRTGIRLAATCALIVGIVAVAWQREWWLAATILVSMTAAMTVAAGIGALVPHLLHRLRRNPTVAAGPAVLAIADLVSLLVYFQVGAALVSQ